MPNIKKKLTLSLLALTLLWLATAGASLFAGAFDASLAGALFAGDALSKTVYLEIRIPRILMATLAGGTLAISGAALQALFRNSLASPFTLGISGGASLGALLAIRLGVAQGVLGFSPVAFLSFVFSMATIFFVYSASKVRGIVSVGRLLLAGVVVNFLYSAFVLFIQFFSDFTQSLQTMRWIMGSLDIVGIEAVWKTALLAIPACVILLSVTRDMNLFALGDDVASSLGVNVRRVEKTVYFATSLAVASVVSVTGPIGFVGLIVPHVLRMILGVDNRLIFPCSFLLGAAFLTGVDAVARTALLPVEIPVGIVTAAIGGIFFFWLLLAMKRDVIL
ncbi:MAG: FecCD family ABC transporter permease [Deltaproteobacteria bacterium]